MNKETRRGVLLIHQDGSQSTTQVRGEAMWLIREGRIFDAVLNASELTGVFVQRPSEGKLYLCLRLTREGGWEVAEGSSVEGWGEPLGEFDCYTMRARVLVFDRAQ